jgi:hypothetical protein
VGPIIDGQTRTIRRVLRPEERQRVETRAKTLGSALIGFPASEADDVELLIRRLFLGFRAMRQTTAEEVDLICNGLSTELREFPMWAIAKAFEHILQGKSRIDVRFPPNDTEIYREVEEVVRFYRQRLKTAEALLSAVEVKTAATPQTTPPGKYSHLLKRPRVQGVPCEPGDLSLSPEQRRAKYADRFTDPAAPAGAGPQNAPDVAADKTPPLGKKKPRNNRKAGALRQASKPRARF